MRYDTVIFDLDGTLLNTLDDLSDSVNHCLEQFGFPKITLSQTRQYVGNGIRKLMARAVPNGEDNLQFEAVFSMFREYYPEHSQIKTKPYDGIPQLLDNLKLSGVKLAVVSNKNHEAVCRLCKSYFGDTFSVTVGKQAGVKRKPAPDSVLQALSALGSEKSKAVYIGDSEVDVATAKAAEMDLIAVSWGFRDRETLLHAGAKVIVDKPEHILDCIHN